MRADGAGLAMLGLTITMLPGLLAKMLGGARLEPPPPAPSCPPSRPECGDPLSPLPRGRTFRPAAAAPPASGGLDRELLSLRLAAAEV